MDINELTSPSYGIELRSVFIGGPFKQLVDPATGVISDVHRVRIETLIDFFESAGSSVYNSHRRESWGAKFLSPRDATLLDFNEIRSSELFVAFPGVPSSPGTHIEIGWASALGVPSILLLEDQGEYAFLVTGLEDLSNVVFLRYRSDTDLMAQLPGAIARAMKQKKQSFEIGPR